MDSNQNPLRRPGPTSTSTKCTILPNSPRLTRIWANFSDDSALMTRSWSQRLAIDSRDLGGQNEDHRHALGALS